MAPRIQRIQQGDRPSGVPRSAPTAASGLEPVLKGLGDLADTGVTLAADAERREAERLRGILEAKQAITNEVAGARMAGDFEEELVGFSENLKKQYWDQPEKVVEAFIQPARDLAGQRQKDASNGQVELDFARQSGARIQAITRQLHDWVDARQTQKAKGDLSVLANRVSAGAETQSLASLPGYLAAKEAQLAPLFQKVYGADSQARLNAMKSDSVRAFLATRDDAASILAAHAALDRTEAGSPLVDNLTGDERKAARTQLQSAFEGVLKRRDFNQLKEGITQNIDLAEAFQGGRLDAGTVFAAQRALEEQKKAIMVGLQDEDALLSGTIGEGRVAANAGFDVKDRKEVLALIDMRLAALKGFDDARRKQTPFDAEDDPDSVAALAVANNKILSKSSPKGKDMKLILEQQKNIATLLGEGKISRATAGTYFKSLALSMKAALTNSEDVLGPDTWFAKYRDPRESGETVLNQELEKRPKLTLAQKNAIRINYEAQFNNAVELNRPADRNAAKNMALRAISLETQEIIPGVR